MLRSLETLLDGTATFRQRPLVSYIYSIEVSRLFSSYGFSSISTTKTNSSRVIIIYHSVRASYFYSKRKRRPKQLIYFNHTGPLKLCFAKQWSDIQFRTTIKHFFNLTPAREKFPCMRNIFLSQNFHLSPHNH